jgi:hypothetical protein
MLKLKGQQREETRVEIEVQVIPDIKSWNETFKDGKKGRRES